MSYSKLTEDLNVISGLSVRPNAVEGMSAAQLRAKFDEAANKIKGYLNDTLIPELEEEAAIPAVGEAALPVAQGATADGVAYVAEGEGLPVVAPGSNGSHVGKGKQIVIIPDHSSTSEDVTLQLNNGAVVPIRRRSETALSETIPAGMLMQGVPYTMTFCGKYWLIDSYIYSKATTDVTDMTAAYQASGEAPFNYLLTLTAPGKYYINDDPYQFYCTVHNVDGTVHHEIKDYGDDNVATEYYYISGELVQQVSRDALGADIRSYGTDGEASIFLQSGAQNLTEKQKTQARQNIGAAAVEDLTGTLQSDYAQNDPTAAGYIKNRTHWKDSIRTAILENVQMQDDDGIYVYFPEGITISDGTPCCVSFNDGDLLDFVWTDGSVAEVADAAGVIYGVRCQDGRCLAIDNYYDLAAAPVVSLYTVTEHYHPLPEGYLPERVLPLVITVSTEDGETWSADKTFDEIDTAYISGRDLVCMLVDGGTTTPIPPLSYISGALYAFRYESGHDNIAISISIRKDKVSIDFGTLTMGGATADSNGSSGLAPAPKAGDQGKVLNGAGEWVPLSAATNARQIADITLTENVSEIRIETDEDGNAFSLSRLFFKLELEPNAENEADSGTVWAYVGHENNGCRDIVYLNVTKTAFRTVSGDATFTNQGLVFGRATGGILGQNSFSLTLGYGTRLVIQSKTEGNTFAAGSRIVVWGVDA